MPPAIAIYWRETDEKNEVVVMVYLYMQLTIANPHVVLIRLLDKEKRYNTKASRDSSEPTIVPHVLYGNFMRPIGRIGNKRDQKEEKYQKQRKHVLVGNLIRFILAM